MDQRERRGAAIGLTQAETLKPALAEGCLAGHEDAIAVQKNQRHGSDRRVLLSGAARISNCSRRI